MSPSLLCGIEGDTSLSSLLASSPPRLFAPSLITLTLLPSIMKARLFSILLALASLPMALPAQDLSPFDRDDVAPLSLGYELTEMGYICSPIQTEAGIVLTNNRHSEIYLLEGDKLTTLRTSPGCGRYMALSPDKKMLGYKLINERGEQAPALLDLMTRQTKQLAPFAGQCGQVAFGPDGMVAYTDLKQLTLIDKQGVRSIDLGFYSNTLAISPDGHYVALSNDLQQPILVDLRDGKQHLLADRTGCFAPKWASSSRFVIYECQDRNLYCFEPACGRVYNMGHGFAPEWVDDETVLFSRSEYVDDDVFFFRGISVLTTRYDGSQPNYVIASSMDCPEEATMLADGRVLVGYANGLRRLVAIDPADPGKEDILYRIGLNDQFGAVLPAMGLSPLHAPKVSTIGPFDIPYINQKTDVAPWRGSYAYGPCACAPSTACMLLGYYHQLPDTPTVVSRAAGKPWGTYIPYSYYVGCTYTSLLTGHTFDLEHTSSCSTISTSGGYGYMWNNGSPYAKMADFYLLNGVEKARRDEDGFATLTIQCNFDRPYSWCITSSRSNGHLILPFAANATCQTNGSEWFIIQMNGSAVVHDPYGNANNSTWAGSDGRHVGYDAQGYNNGQLVMYNAWGVSVHRGDPIPAGPDTALDEVEPSHNGSLISRDGHIFILRDGKAYTLTGQQM